MSKLPQRKNPRLQEYDYKQEGAYFITTCVQERLALFGAIENDEMVTNTAGEMVNQWWEALPSRYPDIELDLWVVMPNHFHGIIIINRYASNQHLTSTSLSQAVGWFKAMSANQYIRGVKNDNWRPFHKKLWQRSFHDHIIRNEVDLQRIREYILYNPSKWQADKYYAD